MNIKGRKLTVIDGLFFKPGQFLAVLANQSDVIELRQACHQVKINHEMVEHGEYV
jgi:hypothetical protein